MNEELLEEQQNVDTENSESTTDSDENQKSGEQDTGSDKKKKSSTKAYIEKLQKEKADALKRIRELEEANLDYSEDEEQPKSSDKGLEERLFFIENPDAKEYKDEISELSKKYPNMPIDEAFSFVKAKYPKSSDSKDFSTRSSTPKKEVKDMSKEEALQAYKNKEIDRATFLKYGRENGRIGK